MDVNYWINLNEFTTYEITVTAIGWVFWITFYGLIIKSIVKDKYVEMPWICVLANISWEFIWGFIFYEQINLGELFIWSYRAWFLLDIFILWGMFKYGKKQIDVPAIKNNFVTISIGLTLMWAALFYTFIDSGFDHKWGSQSAYILNVIISILLLNLFLKQWEFKRFSKLMAWCKCLGTLSYTIVYFNFDPPNSFIHTIGVVVFILDLIYLYLIYTKQGKKWTPNLSKSTF